VQQTLFWFQSHIVLMLPVTGQTGFISSESALLSGWGSNSVPWQGDQW